MHYENFNVKSKCIPILCNMSISKETKMLSNTIDQSARLVKARLARGFRSAKKQLDILAGTILAIYSTSKD